MPNYYCVLSDKLLDVWLNFKKGIITDKNTLEKLLKYIKYPFLAHFSKENIEQISEPSLQRLILSKFPNIKEISLEELADKTLYKIILNNENISNPPYFDISNNEFLENNYVILHKANDNKGNRQSTYDYLKLLLSEVNTLFIHDIFVSKQFDICKTFFEYCLPKHELKIFYTNATFTEQKILTQIKQIHPNWKLKPNNSSFGINNKNHDRYLIIDSKVEIILSSGIDGLFSNDNESALIIRELN